MAGRGSRLRPHTLTTPKPLVPIAGKPIVQRILEELSAALKEKIERVGFIIGDFGDHVPEQLKSIAQSIGAVGSVYYQEEALGPAHAISFAHELMEGKTMVVFADTLFKGHFDMELSQHGYIWVQHVEDPRSFGTVTTDQDGFINGFVEKSPEIISHDAIVGIYYFPKGEHLHQTIRRMIADDIRDKGEYQITTALQLLQSEGTKFKTAHLDEWLDCGNKDAIIHTTRRILDINFEGKNYIAQDADVKNSVILEPCYIGPGSVINHAIVGPYVSIGDQSKIERSVVESSVIQDNTTLKHANFKNTMIGNYAVFKGNQMELSMGDYSKLSQ